MGAGDLAAAQQQIDQGLEQVGRWGEGFYEAELHRLHGEVRRLTRPDGAEAQSHFETALRVARSQRAKSWELRAATSLARLWHSQGKTAKSRDLLAPVYGWFTEGFDTHDLIEAKALLDELNGEK